MRRRACASMIQVSLAVALTAGLSACGGGAATVETANDSATTTPTPTPTPSPTPTPAPTPSPTNSAPVISGTAAAAVTAGQSYSFTPTASDADHDALTFSITNKPTWAAFNTSTGALTGTPTAAQTGTYSGIQIGVSDGKATASMTFAVTVSAATGNNSVTVSWVPPTQNTDGTSAALSGYRIYYGPASGRYTTTITVSSAGLTNYVIDNLAAGTYYFAVTALSSAGDESGYSVEASKVIG